MNGDYTIILVCLKVTCQSKGRHKFTFDCIVRASFDPSQAVGDEAVGPYYWFEFFFRSLICHRENAYCPRDVCLK